MLPNTRKDIDFLLTFIESETLKAIANDEYLSKGTKDLIKKELRLRGIHID